MEIRFKSKVDLWLAGIVVVGLVAASVTILLTAISINMPLVALAALPGVLVLFVTAPVCYVLKSDELEIRSGILRWPIPLREIKATVPCRSMASSPAWSLDRIEIQYGKGSRIQVSPDDAERFMAELDKRRASR